MVRRRFAFTLTEILVALAIASFAFVMMQGAFARISLGLGIAGIDVNLQSDARVFFARLHDDVGHAQLIFSDDGLSKFDFDAHKQIAVVRLIPLDVDDPSSRLKENPYKGYPLRNYQNGRTTQKWPVRKVTYRLLSDAKKQRIERKEEEGMFTRTEQSTLPSGETKFTYDFQSRTVISERQLAENVTRLNVTPLAFAPRSSTTGAPTTIQADPSVVPPSKSLRVHDSSSGTEVFHIAGLVIDYTSSDTRRSARGAEGSFELTTKVWMEYRVLAFRYENSFSSIDERLGF